MKKLDSIIILALLLIGLAGFAANKLPGGRDTGEAKVEIYVDGALYKTVLPSDGTQQIEIQTRYGANTLMVYPDGAKMIWADCASGTCVHTPRQTVSGGVIACLPHKVLVKLTGSFHGGVDAIAN